MKPATAALVRKQRYRALNRRGRAEDRAAEGQLRDREYLKAVDKISYNDIFTSDAFDEILAVNTMVVEDSSGDILSSEATKEARYQKTRKKIERDDKLMRQFSMEKQEYSSALELLRVSYWNDPDELFKGAEKLKTRFPLLQKPKRPSVETDDSEKEDLKDSDEPAGERGQPSDRIITPIIEDSGSARLNAIRAAKKRVANETLERNKETIQEHDSQ